VKNKNEKIKPETSQSVHLVYANNALIRLLNAVNKCRRKCFKFKKKKFLIILSGGKELAWQSLGNDPHTYSSVLQ
jgi:hypothetical protein